jgi:hypothetical protein
MLYEERDVSSIMTGKYKGTVLAFESQSGIAARSGGILVEATDEDRE